MMRTGGRGPECIGITVQSGFGYLVNASIFLNQILCVAIVNDRAKFFEPLYIGIGQQSSLIGASPSINWPALPTLCS